MGQSGPEWEGMLLTGTHPRTLDEKSRLALPKRVRDLLGEPTTLYVTPGPEQTLWLYTEAELEKLAAKLDQAPASDTETRLFRRLYFAQTEAVEVDKSGRILVPERLGKFAGLHKEVVLLGVRDHLELWDANKWQTYVDTNASKFDEAFSK